MSEQSVTGPHPAVRSVARKAHDDEVAATDRLAQRGITPDRIAAGIEGMRTNARLTLNFHPDRRDSMGRTVAAGLLVDGRYRSQFETGISNGARFAVPGGDRTRWEGLLFDDVYDTQSLTRPVYGALDLFHDPYGGAPRFGSSFVVLAPHCFHRATLCVGDSHVGPRDLGTASALTSILAGAVDDCFDGDGFGRGLTAESLVERLGSMHTVEPSARELDRYIEAQIHGEVALAGDVAQVILDPSFRGTEIQRDMEQAARRFGFEVRWNEGSTIAPSDINPDFRGHDMQGLARGCARDDGLVDAAAIGRALNDVTFTPPTVSGDPEESPRQKYKKLWHCCLHFGVPPGGHKP